MCDHDVESSQVNFPLTLFHFLENLLMEQLHFTGLWLSCTAQSQPLVVLLYRLELNSAWGCPLHQLHYAIPQVNNLSSFPELHRNCFISYLNYALHKKNSSISFLLAGTLHYTETWACTAPRNCANMSSQWLPSPRTHCSQKLHRTILWSLCCPALSSLWELCRGAF